MNNQEENLTISLLATFYNMCLTKTTINKGIEVVTEILKSKKLI